MKNTHFYIILIYGKILVIFSSCEMQSDQHRGQTCKQNPNPLQSAAPQKQRERERRWVRAAVRDLLPVGCGVESALLLMQQPMRSDTWLQDRKRQGLWVKWVLARVCRKPETHPHLCTLLARKEIRSRNVSEHTHTHTLSIYSVGTSASLRGSEGLPAHLLKIKQSAVMSYLISLRQGDEKHFSRKSRVCDRLNAQTSL